MVVAGTGTLVGPWPCLAIVIVIVIAIVIAIVFVYLMGPGWHQKTKRHYSLLV